VAGYLEDDLFQGSAFRGYLSDLYPAADQAGIQLGRVGRADHQAAALWLGGAANLFDVAKRPWLRNIVKAYGVWTFSANGSELEEDEDTDHPPREWNGAFFKVLAYCLPGLTAAQVDDVALAPITGLPERAFFHSLCR